MKIRNKVLLISFIVVIIFVLGLFLVVYPGYKESLVESYIYDLKLQLEHVNHYMREFTGNIEDDLNYLSNTGPFETTVNELRIYVNTHEISEIPNQSESESQLHEHFLHYAITNNRIDNIFFGSKNGAFVTSEMNEDDKDKFEEWLSFDPRSMPWYVQANEDENVVLSVPYIDESDNSVHIKASKSIAYNNVEYGVVGMEVNISSLSEYLVSVRQDEPGMLGMINGDVMLSVIDDDVSLMPYSEEYKVNVESIHSHDLKYIMIGPDDEQIMVLVDGVSQGWHYFIIVDTTVVTNMVNDTFINVYTPVVMFFIVILLCLLIFNQHYIVKPITTMKEMTSEIATTGDLNYRVSKFNSMELDVMSDSFNQMIDKLRENKLHLEEQVLSRTRELTQQQIFLETLINSLSTLIVVKDNNNHIILANDIFRTIFHIEKKDIIGHPIDSLISQENIEKLFLYDESSNESFSKENQLLIDGEMRDFLFTMLQIKNELEVVSTCVIGTEITQYKKAESILIEAKEQAEETVKIKSDFLANMSHEIRTPMNAIIGLGALLERTALDTKQIDYVDKINRSSKNLLGIINDILDFSKIEAGKLSMDKINFSLNEVLGNISSIIGFKASDKSVAFHIIKEYDVPDLLVGDPLRINQILLNLCNNAIKFTDEGEVCVRVKILEKAEDCIQLRYSVTDTGIGMTKEQLSRLFNAFSQADTSITRRYGGTGLGLAISKRLVEMMHGQISVKSRYGEGSEFYFDISFAYNKDANMQTRIVPEYLTTINVAVLEMNTTVIEVLRNYLVKQLSSVEIFNDVNEFVKACQNNKFDLLLLDNDLGEHNGIEVWKLLKNTSIESIPKSIILSQYGDEYIIDEAEAVGVDSVLFKPLTQSALYDGMLLVLQGDAGRKKKRKIDNLLMEMELYKGNDILLVEDNVINQQVIMDNLMELGFLVDVANNGLEAVEMIKNRKDFYDLVLMDLQMPVMDGFTATEEIRKMFDDKQLPIIALSADVIQETIERIKSVGAQVHVAKPINLNDLFEAMKSLLEPKSKKEKSTVNRIEEDYSIIIDRLYLLDTTNALNRLNNNHNVYIKLLSSFYENYHSININKVLTMNDETLYRFCHTLKGLAGNIGANHIMSLSEHIETLLNQSNENVRGESLKQQLSALIQEVHLLCKHLQEEVTEKINSKIAVEKKLMSDTEFKQKIKTLINLLESYDMSSLEIFQILLHDIKHRVKRKKFDVLNNAVNNLDFDTAVLTLKDLDNEI